MTILQNKLENLNACNDARQWVGTRTAAKAWAAAAAAAAAAADAYDAYAAYADARKAMQKQCVDIVRKHYPKPPKF
jgi:hypothetical protein